VEILSFPLLVFGKEWTLEKGYGVGKKQPTNNDQVGENHWIAVIHVSCWAIACSCVVIATTTTWNRFVTRKVVPHTPHQIVCANWSFLLFDWYFFCFHIVHETNMMIGYVIQNIIFRLNCNGPLSYISQKFNYSNVSCLSLMTIPH
jgi:hypothetical protein